MLQSFVVMVYLKILKRCPMTLATTVDAIALIQIQSLCLDLSQAMLHQPLPLREGRPNRVNLHQTYVSFTEQNAVTRKEKLVMKRWPHAKQMIRHLSFKIRLIFWSCNTWIRWSFNLTYNVKRVQIPSNMLSRSYTLKIRIYSKWTRNWRGQYSGILLCWNSGICEKLCYQWR